MEQDEHSSKNGAPTEDTPTCHEPECSAEATHTGPSETAKPNPPIVGWCDEHASTNDKPL